MPGPDGILAEIFKSGGLILKQKLHQHILKVGETEELPLIQKGVNTVTIFKKGIDLYVGTIGTSPCYPLLACSHRLESLSPIC